MSDLHVERRGEGPRVVLLHGFTLTGRCWGPVADDLAADHEVVVVDLPRHGRSQGVGGDLVAVAARLAELGPATVLGYSLGARAALTLAVHHPAAVARLVLVSGTAGIDDPGERAARQESDEALARSIERDGVDAFLERWLALPLFADLPRERACLAERRTNDAAALAASLREVGTGTMAPLWSELGRVTCPTLLVTGELDERYGALAERLAAGVSGPARHVVADCGHAVPAVAPRALLDAVRSWEAMLDAAPPPEGGPARAGSA